MFLLEPLWTVVSPTQVTMTSIYVHIMAFRLNLCKIFTYTLCIPTQTHACRVVLRVGTLFSQNLWQNPHIVHVHSATILSLFMISRVPANHVTIMFSMMTLSTQLMICRMSPSSCAICFHTVTAVCPTQLQPTVRTWQHVEPATSSKTGRTKRS